MSKGKKIPIPTKEELHDLYIVQMKSYREIMNYYGGNSARTVKRWLTDYNIPIRHGSEAIKNQWKNNGERRRKNAERLKIHGLANKRLFSTWQDMKRRCYKPYDIEYLNYGGRGITVCPEWQEFKPFYDWAISNGYDENAPRGQCTLERIDNNGNYEPSNCRWATMKEQQNNRRNNRLLTLNGETKTLQQWADITGIARQVISDRLERGWPIEKALTEKPVKGRNQYNKSTP